MIFKNSSTALAPAEEPGLRVSGAVADRNACDWNPVDRRTFRRGRKQLPIALALTLGTLALSAMTSVVSPAVAAPPPTESIETPGATDSTGAPRAPLDAPERAYVRVVENERGKPTALQTAILRFSGKPETPYAGRHVDLVGVVHIGQGDYYRQLREKLATYDKVLYELVAPDGTRFRPEDLQNNASPVSSLQGGMKDLLNLEFQLEKIDYMASNFRHADMSPEEFRRDQQRRGDATWKMAARAVGGELSSGTRGLEMVMAVAMLSKNRAKIMKRAVARKMADMDRLSASLNDAQGENTIISGRNAKAMKILREELVGGARSVAVFYGAAHLADMADRLESDFQLRHVETTWLDAWDLTQN